MIRLGYLIIFSTSLYTTQPDWSVDPSEYSHQGILTGTLLINNDTMGDGNLLGAFSGDSCRGVVLPIEHNDGWLYFMTIYANEDGETINFKAWFSELDTVLNIEETILFSQGFTLGGPDNPYGLNAYLDYDFPPSLSGIPDQSVHYGESFVEIRLYDYFETNDSDPVSWTVVGQQNLIIDFSDSLAYVSSVESWTGSESLIFSVTENTENEYLDSDTAIFTVLPEDNYPYLSEIPDQEIGINNEFSLFNLNTYLEELDGNDIQFSYEYSNHSEPETDPLWIINQSDYEFNMSVTMLVESQGLTSDGSSHILAAIGPDGSVRGVSSAIEHFDSWIYFMTIFAHETGDTISFRFYDQNFLKNFPVKEKIIFSPDEIMGGPDAPLIMQAGFIITEIDTSGLVSMTKSDPMWSGTETIIFYAQDIGTGNSFSSIDSASFTILEGVAPNLSGIPDQILQPGSSFSNIELSDYLDPFDGDVIWSVNGQSFIEVVLEGSLASISSPQDWMGTEAITFTATEDVYGLSSSDRVTMQILNYAPELSNITDQSIQEDTILELELTAYDIENDVVNFGSNVLSGDINVSILGDTLLVSPGSNWTGFGEVEVIAYDTYGSDTVAFNLSVTPVEDIPIAVLVNNFTAMRGQEIVLTGQGSYDDDGDSLIFYWTFPEGLNNTSDVAQDIRFMIPDSSEAIQYFFSLKVFDGKTISAPDSLIISVDDFNVDQILPSLEDLVLNTGENIVFNISIPEYFDVDSISLNYSSAFSGFISSDMIANVQRSTSYSFNIPFYMAGLEGLVYFVYVEDQMNNIIITDTTDIPLSFDQETVSTSMLYSAHSEGLKKDSWRLISIPSIVDNNTVEYIFNNQLNGGPSETSWMLYEWSNSDWVVPLVIRHGQGYWIKQLDYENLQLNLGSGTTVNLSGFNIVIEPGWNQISSPYLFPVHANIDAEIFSELFTYGNQSTEGWLDTNITTMVPWGAYAIHNASSKQETLKLAPLDYEPRSVGKKQSIFDNWNVKISLRNGKYADLKNVFGMMELSDNGLDSNDCPELPTVGKYISLYSKLGNEGGGYEKLTMDFRPFDDSLQVWDLALETNMGEIDLNMKLEATGDLQGKHLWVLDMQTRASIQLMENQITYHPTNMVSSSLKNYYRLVYGKSEDVISHINKIFENIPENFSLGNNYPNPFNPETVIPYSIPEPSHVTINIYDIRGREVKQIVNEYLGSGFYTTKWNGTNFEGFSVSTGIYYYGIRAKTFNKYKKMLILK